MNPSKLLDRLRLNTIRNVIIYTSFIVLVISLLFPLQNISNSFVQKASLTFLVYGLYLWMLREILGGFVYKSHRDSEANFFLAIWLILALFGFIVTFKLAFGVKFLSLIFPR